MAFEPGKRVGDYEVIELLGTGGMGEVYRARNIISDRIEALKVLRPDLSADKEFASRFISEIRTLASLDHPNIALLHTAFQSDNQLIMVMEYVKGNTLEQQASQTLLSTAEIVDLSCQALSALSYAHLRSVIHRDIKPANLMVTNGGVVKLMDFGIAKTNLDINLTQTGATVGSFYYMSPEQVNCSRVDSRSDIYSIGIVLYELLAGQRPFEGDSTYGVLDKQLHFAPQPPIELNPSLPPQLNAIVLRTLAKDPADRFQTADDLRNALKPFGTESSGKITPVAFVAPSSQSPPPPIPPDLPAFQPVPMPQSSSAAQPILRSANRTSKPLWIATGALAAVIAIAGIAIALPHLLKTHASESTPHASVPPQGQPQVAPVAAFPAPAAPAQHQDNSLPASALATVATAPAVAIAPSAAPRPADQVPLPPPQSAPVSPAADPAEAQLEQLQERYIQLDARARTVDSAVSQIRRQQEADGLGLRNDMESASAKLNSYMQAATRDLQSARPASAARDLDKAEAEIDILEKFLGR